MEHLQSFKRLTSAYPFRICIICNNKRRLSKILENFQTFKISDEKHCDWVGFVYFNEFKAAKKLRKQLSSRKHLYVFIQDDILFFTRTRREKW